MTRRVSAARACTASLAVVLLIACAGGMPRVPANPQAVLDRAAEYRAEGKNMQATALYQQFLDSYPGHERADYAQFQLAETQFAEGEYALAAVEYQVVITSYSYSEWIDDALFQIGVCYWKDAPRAARDQQKSMDALSRFNQFLQIYPGHEREGEARAYITAINERLAEKTMTAAHWYYRQHTPKAALIYCDKVIQNYPGNPYWADALYLKGQILLDRGEYEEAIKQFTQLLELPGESRVKRDAEAKIREARRSMP